MREFPKEDRADELDSLMRREGRAMIDIGTGGTFSLLMPQRNFQRVVAINTHQPVLDILRERHEDRPDWEFVNADVREYAPPADGFDLVLMSHVAEHLTLPDLGAVLDKFCLLANQQIVLETPEQFDDNMAFVNSENNPHELHISLVTAEFLAPWGFVPWARYWQNERFSNAIYVREA